MQKFILIFKNNDLENWQTKVLGFQFQKAFLDLATIIANTYVHIIEN